MPLLFWLDITALSISAVITISLVMIVLGAGPRRALNWSFALFALMEALWIVSTLFLRLSLWLEPILPSELMISGPLFWVELSGISIGLTNVLSLMFAALFLGRRTRRTDLGLVLGLLLVIAFAIPTFRHQMFFNPRLDANGITTVDVSAWGWVGIAATTVYMTRSLALFWQERHRTGELHLALGMLILLLGVILVGVFGAPAPFLSVSSTLGAVILGHAVISRQILNPLRERAIDLQREVTERERVEKALRQRTAQLEALEAATAVVNSTLDYDEMLNRILEQISRMMPQAVANIMLVRDDSTHVLRGHGYEQFGTATLPSPVNFDVAGVVGLQKMQETGQSLVIPDVERCEEWMCSRPEHAWIKSYIGVPICIRDRVIGFLNVDSATPGFFSQADAERLQAFANHAATAIENAQLHRHILGYAEWLEQGIEDRTAGLQAQRAQLDAILGSIADGIVVTDGKGDIIQANSVAQAWLNKTLSPEEAGRLREKIRDLARRAATEAAVGETPEVVLELTGIDLELNAAPVVGDRAEETLVVVNIHDISHLKALDRMKTRFVTNISHELRTPITTVKLYVHLIQRQPGNWKKHLDALAREADRLARLIEDILEISRIDAGRMELNPRPLSLNKLTGVAVAGHRDLIGKRKLTLEHRPAEPGPVTLADPERMKQVLNNLMGNAIRYTPEGGKVTVSTGTEEAEGRLWATVTVTDTGLGIPEEELPYIFDRFFRGEKPRAMQLTGTGLGLSIVYEVVALHGGHVTVESEEGVGSTFTIWLPLTGQKTTTTDISNNVNILTPTVLETLSPTRTEGCLPDWVTDVVNLRGRILPVVNL